MGQGQLFTERRHLDRTSGYDPNPMARRADPISSHIAADRYEASGGAKRQRERALELIVRWPGSTTARLATLGTNNELDRLKLHVALQRRTSELRRAGVARSVETADGLLWFPE